MSIVRWITIRCNNCTGRFHSPPDTWVEGPVRAEAGHDGWKLRAGKDYCPDCVKELKIK